MKTTILVCVLGWLLMTPRGPILHEGVPVRFASRQDCEDTSSWLNNTQLGRRWYWCQADAQPPQR